MKKALKIAGTVGGYLGVVVCIIAIVGRFYGEPLVFGFDASNVLLLGATILASLYPAWHAARTDPAAALRVAQ